MLDLNLLTQLIGNLEEKEMISCLEDFVNKKPTEEEAQKAIMACQDGMKIIGDNFEKGEYFIGDLIYAGELLKEAMNILNQVIKIKNNNKIGKIILGTVKNDIHDIGKNIFKSMAESAGFEVYDLGVDVSADAFVEKVREIKPNIVGLSGVLTLAIEEMKNTIDGLKIAKLLNDVKVIIGGACASYDAMITSGANEWSTNAAEAVNICLEWVK